MSVKRRERLEVIYDLLRIVRDHHNSIKPTPLLRFSNLSPTRYAEYHAELISKEFIKEMIDAKGNKYITLSDKGFRYLEKYNHIRDLLNEFEL